MHIVRQQALHMGSQRLFVMIGIRLGNKRQNAPLCVDHHRDLPIQPAGPQAMLDLFRLDPKAANLHLIIASAAQDNTISRPLCDVSGAIGAQLLTLRQRQPHIALGRKLGIVDVTQAHAGADDIQLTLSLLGHGLQVLVQNPHLTVGNRSPQMTIAAGRLKLAGSDQHRGFCRAIQIMEMALPAELRNHMRLADVTAGHHMLDSQRLIQRQDAQQRRRQKRMGDALFQNADQL